MAANHAVIGDVGRLIPVQLVIRARGGGGRGVVQVVIRLPLGEVANCVGVVAVDLMVSAGHVVDAQLPLPLGEVEIRSGREHVGDALAEIVALVTEEEVNFVAEDGPADRAAVLVLIRVGLFERPIGLLDEDRGRGHRRVRQVAESRSVKRVGAALRDRIHHTARRPAEFHVELIGLHLEFFNGLERRPRLGARGRRGVIVGVVPAVEHEGNLVIALTVDADRVGALVARVVLDSRDHGDEPDEVARRRRQLEELLAFNVAADLR